MPFILQDGAGVQVHDDQRLMELLRRHDLDIHDVSSFRLMCQHVNLCVQCS